ncbi:hypothetical protein LTR95_011106 [Oleoguttula sp. CCFEE 5521]
MANQAYGLLPVAVPRDAIVDIIFVHGLTGDRIDTWTTTKLFWPKHCLQHSFPQARIFTHGYNANIRSKGTGIIQDFARDLLHGIHNYRSEDETSDRPLIFIAHSLGGLLVKRAVLLCQEHNAPSRFAAIGTSVVGVMFMGTPHHGARVAVWGDRLLRLVKTFASFNDRILHELRSDEDGLSRLQAEFEIFLEGEGAQMSVFCFYEEETYFNGQKVAHSVVHTDVRTDTSQIVDDASAILASRPHDCMAIHANHVNMTKFTNPDDSGYLDVCGVLRDWIAACGQVATSTPGAIEGSHSRDSRIAMLFKMVIRICERQVGMPEGRVDTSETIPALHRAATTEFKDTDAAQTSRPQILYEDTDGNCLLLRCNEVYMRYEGRVFPWTPLKKLLPIAATAMERAKAASTDENYTSRPSARSPTPAVSAPTNTRGGPSASTPRQPPSQTAQGLLISSFNGLSIGSPAAQAAARRSLGRSRATRAAEPTDVRRDFSYGDSQSDRSR